MPDGWYNIMIIFLMLSETHKDGYDEFKKDCFGTKRTKKDFSRYRIDLANIGLTLEHMLQAKGKGLKFHILQIQYLQASE